MASKKPARSAKKSAKTAAAKKPAQAKKAVKALEPAKGPRIKDDAVPTKETAGSGASDAPGPGGGRTESIQSGLAKLRQRLRFSPSKSSPLGRNPSGSRTGQDPERLDAALKRLSESYRDLFK